MAATKQNVVRDPGVTVGRFKILQRTDGKWIVVDPDLPPGAQTVSMHGAQDVAERAAAKRVKDAG